MLVVVALAGALGACPAPDLFELPIAPLPERAVDAGPPEPNATCARGDGCSSFECAFLDVDCADGLTCADDELCTSACFEPDPDCTRAADGLSCNFGEQCASLQCVAIDGDGTCVSSCAADGSCAPGFHCVDGAARVCAPDGC